MAPNKPFHAHEALFEHADFLRRLAWAILRDEHRAEDVLQEAWVTALERTDQLASKERGYLATLVRNLARNVGRGEHRRDAREEAVALPEAQVGADDVAANLEIQRCVFDAVQELEEPYKSAVYLRYFEGLTPRRVAERQCVSVKTVKTRLHRALGQLRAKLDRHTGGDRKLWVSALLPIAGGREAVTVGGSVGFTIGGLVVMKKLWIAVGLVLVGVGMWNFLGGRRELSRSADPPEVAQVLEGLETSPGEVSSSVEAQTAEGTALESDERRAVDADEVAAPTLGNLEIELLWEETGEPAVGIWLQADAENDPAPRATLLLSRTDARGTARFGGLAEGTIHLGIDRGRRLDFELKAGETRRETLRIPEGPALRGRVMDAAGHPVSDADIWVEGIRRSWPNALLLTKTLGDGSFELRGMGPGTGTQNTTRVGARAAGYLPSLLFQVGSLPIGSDGARWLELELEPGGGRVEGRVLDPNGDPVEDARVLIGQRGGYLVDLPDGRRGEHATPVPIATDADGRFESSGSMPPGSHLVYAMSPGFPVWEGEVVVAAERKTPMEIHLSRSARIFGRVLGFDGTPYSGARVLVAVERDVERHDHPFPPLVVVSGEDGSFEFDWVAPGQREVLAANWNDPRAGRAKATLTCVAGQSHRLDLVLDRGATIQGVVVDSNDQPLVGWDVRAKSAGYGADLPRADKTDGSGAFVLSNLGDSEFHISVIAPEGDSRRPQAEIDFVARGTSDLVIRVQDVKVPNAYVEGRLLSAGGEVPTDVNLLITPLPGVSSYIIRFDPETGRFEHGPLVPGRFRVWVLRGNQTLAETDEFELLDREREDVGLITIGTLGSLVFTLEGLESDELAELYLVLNREPYGSGELRLEEGRWHSGGLLAGTWDLRVRKSRLFVPNLSVDIEPGRVTEISFHATQPCVEVEVSLELADPDKAWELIELEVRDAAGEIVCSAEPIRKAWSRSSSNLRFQNLTLPKGQFSLHATSDSGMEGRGTLKVEMPSAAQPRCELILE